MWIRNVMRAFALGACSIAYAFADHAPHADTVRAVAFLGVVLLAGYWLVINIGMADAIAHADDVNKQLGEMVAFRNRQLAEYRQGMEALRDVLDPDEMLGALADEVPADTRTGTVEVDR